MTLVDAYFIMVLFKSFHAFHSQGSHFSIGDDLSFERRVGGQLKFIQKPNDVLTTATYGFLASCLSHN